MPDTSDRDASLLSRKTAWTRSRHRHHRRDVLRLRHLHELRDLRRLRDEGVRRLRARLDAAEGLGQGRMRHRLARRHGLVRIGAHVQLVRAEVDVRIAAAGHGRRRTSTSASAVVTVCSIGWYCTVCCGTCVGLRQRRSGDRPNSRARCSRRCPRARRRAWWRCCACSPALDAADAARDLGRQLRVLGLQGLAIGVGERAAGRGHRDVAASCSSAAGRLFIAPATATVDRLAIGSGTCDVGVGARPRPSPPALATRASSALAAAAAASLNVERASSPRRVAVRAVAVRCW